MNVTVFGGSQPQPGDPAYEEARHLGRLLGEAGHTVLTGGYIGTMEAVSRGANEAGGHVVGVTCQEIENWRPVRANIWVIEERAFPSLRERLFALIDGCDAAIALPGGAGTLAEISLMWNQLIIGAIPPHPLILIGVGWKQVYTAFFEHLGVYTKDSDRRWLAFAENVEDAFRQIEAIHQNSQTDHSIG